MKKRILAALTASIVSGLLCATTACSAPSMEQGKQLSSEDVKAIGQREQKAGHIESAKLLADGVVDKADYDKAFTNLRSCMKSLGYGVSDPAVSPVDGLALVFEYDSLGRDPKVYEDDMMKCEAKHWAEVSAVYMSTNPQVMEEPLRVAALECLKHDGFEPPADASSLRAMSGDPDKDGGAQRQAATICITRNAAKLHPEMHNIGLYG